ncbi:hypothetical protein DYB35_011542 [Aphanomyces astaci]|uniref:Uncharacterized protein n=1 Tax=Aphanomyces astaci TaxID=112090 RepID=A0A3R6ZA79_APHAT|nr:hypothetical protein DYB35_011542 [Aphanomyces astaci]
MIHRITRYADVGKHLSELFPIKHPQVETSRMLLFMFAVLVFVICLEMFLHVMEHTTKRKPKYTDMLHKTTQELMIVGLIYLLVKLCVSTGLAKGNGLSSRCLGSDSNDKKVYDPRAPPV